MFCIYNIFSRPYQEEGFFFYAKIVAIFSFIVSFWGIMEVLTGSDFLYEHFLSNPYYERYIKYFLKPVSFQYNPTPLSTFIACSWLFCLHFYNKTKGPWHLFALLSLVINSACFIFASSRGSFVGVFAALLVYLWIIKKRRLIIALVLSAVVFSRFSYNLAYPFNLLSFKVLTTYGILTPQRIAAFKMGLVMLKERGLLSGIGLQNFRALFDAYYPLSNLPSVHYEFKILDNMWFSLLIEAGIVGFLGFLIFLGHHIWQGLKIYAGSKNVILIVLPLIAFVFILFGYDALYWPGQYMFFCLLMALLAGFIRDESFLLNFR